jgi:hypothetical protein
MVKQPRQFTNGSFVDRPLYDRRNGSREELPFAPQGAGYDYSTLSKLQEIPFSTRNPYLPVIEGENIGHTVSSATVSDLIRAGILSLEDIEEYDIPPKSSFLLKGWNHNSIGREIEAAREKGLEYKLVPTPLGNRYLLFEAAASERPPSVTLSLDPSPPPPEENPHTFLDTVGSIMKDLAGEPPPEIQHAPRGGGQRMRVRSGPAPRYGLQK